MFKYLKQLSDHGTEFRLDPWIDLAERFPRIRLSDTVELVQELFFYLLQRVIIFIF